MNIKGISREVLEGRETTWLNPGLRRPQTDILGPGAAAVADASARLRRFAPVIRHYFPETEAAGGIIESPLVDIPNMKSALEHVCGTALEGRMMLKMDSHLPVSGSVKARGGIYEVLKHTEDLAIDAGILSGTDDDYLKVVSPEAREFFARHKIQVGSTGNLGLSIGIMSSALGYDAIVHMSSDAKQWKKDLLRSRGATVREYDGDYSEAVDCGRRESDADESSYFVDDERSTDLFLGYAVAGERLRSQLDAKGVAVDAEHPLYVYVPCGVGGAPGGILYGLKLIYGDAVHCFIIEPVQAACMLVGLQSGLYEKISVQDAGLSGVTEADGLAVGRPSGFVSRIFSRILEGEVTVDDSRLKGYLRMLNDSENILIEPSACAAFQGPVALASAIHVPSGATNILWATGGSMVPQDIWNELLND
jgi:D-serine ammonia-lyase